MLYSDYIKSLHEKFVSSLIDIKGDYNFDLGDEFEIAICEVLRRFLPNKYGICRGSVVTANGNKAGDDIIIYDQELFPTLWLRNRDDFSRKENIPCEAVYAYIEAKHGYSEAALKKAFEQVRAFKLLCSTREKRGQYQLDSYITDNRCAAVRGLPSYRNPVLGMVLIRNANHDNNTTTENISNILKTLDKDINYPDVIVIGENNGAFVGFQDGEESVPTIFALPNEANKCFGYQNFVKHDLMFGIFMAHLMSALDYIRLGKMPWTDILNDAKLS